MNKKQYNNVIENTLKHEKTDDSLSTARAIFDNMGVALPQGDIKIVYETIKTNNYMGWKSCTMKEAQEAANNGVAAIGISEDKIVVLSANDEEQPVAQTASVMTLDENTSAFAVEGMQYYSYSYGRTTTAPIPFCGGYNYRDITEHNMVLNGNGYYVCTRCGFTVKSPELEDKDVLSTDDYLQVFSCLMFYSYIEVLKCSYPGVLDLPTAQNIALQLATEIRQKSKYQNAYSYSDSSGKCIGPAIDYNHNHSTVQEGLLSLLDVFNYNRLDNAINELIVGLYCPEFSLAQDIVDLITHQMTAIDFSAMILEYLGYNNIADGLSLASEVIESVNTNVSLEDKVIFVDLGRVLNGRFIFDSNNKFKMVQYYNYLKLDT